MQEAAPVARFLTAFLSHALELNRCRSNCSLLTIPPVGGFPPLNNPWLVPHLQTDIVSSFGRVSQSAWTTAPPYERKRTARNGCQSLAFWLTNWRDSWLIQVANGTPTRTLSGAYLRVSRGNAKNVRQFHICRLTVSRHRQPILRREFDNSKHHF
jgi:hypothetical protein